MELIKGLLLIDSYACLIIIVVSLLCQIAAILKKKARTWQRGDP